MKRKSKNLQGRECYRRMNFLYQASMLMAGRNNVLSAFYGKLCKNIGKKATLRIAPSIKRDLCKRCSLAQKPGLTSYLNVKSQKRRTNKQSSSSTDEGSQVQLVCELCGYKRNFNVSSNYNIWLENPECVAEECTLDLKQSSSNENKPDVKNNPQTK
uniref:Uncharacterized protein n=1 Tax=Glossina brevipalpis TaxID=37001 RepID=A0A1A9WVN7_9MUSC